MLSITHRAGLERPISSRLHWTAEYFRICAGFNVVGMAVFVILAVAGFRPARDLFVLHPAQAAISLLLSGLSTVGWWLTGEALNARRRVGGLLALSTMLPPLVRSVFDHRTLGMGLLIPLLGTVALLTSWRELE